MIVVAATVALPMANVVLIVALSVTLTVIPAPVVLTRTSVMDKDATTGVEPKTKAPKAMSVRCQLEGPSAVPAVAPITTTPTLMHLLTRPMPSPAMMRLVVMSCFRV